MTIEEKAEKEFDQLIKKFGGVVAASDCVTNLHKRKLLSGELQCFPVVELADGSVVAHCFEIGGWIRIK